MKMLDAVTMFDGFRFDRLDASRSTASFSTLTSRVSIWDNLSSDDKQCASTPNRSKRKI